MADIHHSITKRVVGNVLILVECRSSDCKECFNLKKGLYHCPLCPLGFRIRSKLKDHHHSVHWNNRICFGEYIILKCRNKCLAVPTKKEKIWWDKPHYHCFGCDNLFTKSRAQLHYSLHSVHTSDNIHVQSNPQHAYTEHTMPLPLQQTPSGCEYEPGLQPEITNAPLNAPIPMMTTLHNIGPSAAPFTRPGSTTGRIPCPHCSREFHPRSLKVHIDSQHTVPLGNSGNAITSTSYHVGVCVDEGAGVFLVRRNRSGVGFSTHVQYCPNGNPPVMACQVDACQQVMDTAARSGLQGYICRHLQSVPFLSKSVQVQPQLGSDSLSFLIETLHLLRPSRKEECLRYQAAATRAGVSMIVQLIGNSYTSSRYLHFSVWDEDERKKWWSFNGRVSVTYDCEQHIWFCKHVKGSQSCIHKTIVKWYMAETKQFPDHLQS